MSTTTARSSLRDTHLHQHHYNHHDHHHQRYHYNHPSFSSTLLEEIYRSFDQERDDHHHITDNYRMKKTQSASSYLHRDNVDRWMDLDNDDKANLRRSALSETKYRRRPMNYSSSTTSSSDSSSCVGGFSSSDTESLYGCTTTKMRTPSLKPIRTTPAIPAAEFHRESYSDEFPATKKKKKEGNLQKRALKLYGDLKKVKQPISPGGKLATFLNSLFTAKPKMSSAAVKYDRESPAMMTSRSCLSKTPSSAGGRFERRSVRFVDEGEDERSHVRRARDVAKRDEEEFKIQVREKHRRAQEKAKELLKNYHHIPKFGNDVSVAGGDDDGDDVSSCCSSDLFELDVGYREELPVYETTRVDKNRAIANGFLL